jgi:hypothetical protein
MFRVDIFASNNYQVIERTNYTFLQFIGDVGALSDTLFKIVALILGSVFQLGFVLDSHLINGVFRMRGKRKNA